jgi:hypothetical protein
LDQTAPPDPWSPTAGSEYLDACRACSQQRAGAGRRGRSGCDQIVYEDHPFPAHPRGNKCTPRVQSSLRAAQRRLIGSFGASAQDRCARDAKAVCCAHGENTGVVKAPPPNVGTAPGNPGQNRPQQALAQGELGHRLGERSSRGPESQQLEIQDQSPSRVLVPVGGEHSIHRFDGGPWRSPKGSSAWCAQEGTGFPAAGATRWSPKVETRPSDAHDGTVVAT